VDIAAVAVEVLASQGAVFVALPLVPTAVVYSVVAAAGVLDSFLQPLALLVLVRILGVA
jgi:hypothetical protein